MWFVGSCPCASECSDQAWKRVQAWSYQGPEEVRRKVATHLCNSCLHRTVLNMKEAEEVAAELVIDTYEDTHEEYMKWVRSKEKKKDLREKSPKRRSPVRGGAARRGPLRRSPVRRGPAPRSPAGDEYHDGDVIIGDRSRTPERDDRSLRPASFLSDPSASGAIVPRRHGVHHIGLREGELKTIVDCIDRARRSARQAESLCGAAARQFSQEALILEEANDLLKTKLGR